MFLLVRIPCTKPGTDSGHSWDILLIGLLQKHIVDSLSLSLERSRVVGELLCTDCSDPIWSGLASIAQGTADACVLDDCLGGCIVVIDPFEIWGPMWNWIRLRGRQTLIGRVQKHIVDSPKGCRATQAAPYKDASTFRAVLKCLRFICIHTPRPLRHSSWLLGAVLNMIARKTNLDRPFAESYCRLS